jgi:SAM-dependent methyltransferase
VHATQPTSPEPRADSEYWDKVWASGDRRRFPNFANVGNRNLRAVLRRELAGSRHVLEVGCAPGKWLAWLAASEGKKVAGLDFASGGVDETRRRLAAAGVSGDIRCEDVFRHSFEPGTFDAVYSAGVVEHFDDPRPCLAAHLGLTKPGGRVVVLVPHYGGLYGRLQRRLDPGNLAIHNLSIMSSEALGLAMREAGGVDVRARAVGRASPWILSLHRAVPPTLARAASLGLNVAGILQPLEWSPLCPLLLVTATRPKEDR